MERTITTDNLITLEALRMHRHMMLHTAMNTEIAIFSLLMIDPKDEQSMKLVDSFIETDMNVVDLMLGLGMEVVDGKEEADQANQQQREGEASGEGAVGGTELDTTDLD